MLAAVLAACLVSAIAAKPGAERATYAHSRLAAAGMGARMQTSLAPARDVLSALGVWRLLGEPVRALMAGA